MDPGTLIGIVVGFLAILVGMTMEGASLGSLIEPSSAVIVILGTLGATMGGYLVKDTTGVAAVVKNAFLGKVHKPDGAIKQVVQMAEQARREGLLSLEDAAKTIDDPFLQKGIQMAVDGTDLVDLWQVLTWVDDTPLEVSLSALITQAAQLAAGLVQPLLWLFVLGTGLSRVVSVGQEDVDYRTFLLPRSDYTIEDVPIGNGVKISALIAGPEEGEPLLLMHGLGATKAK